MTARLHVEGTQDHSATKKSTRRVLLVIPNPNTPDIMQIGVLTLLNMTRALKFVEFMMAACKTQRQQ
jgi:hypothetical protein